MSDSFTLKKVKSTNSKLTELYPLRLVTSSSNDYFSFNEKKPNAESPGIRNRPQLMAAGIFIVAMKLLNVPDRTYNDAFDIASNYCSAASDLNILAMVITNIVKSS